VSRHKVQQYPRQSTRSKTVGPPVPQPSSPSPSSPVPSSSQFPVVQFTHSSQFAAAEATNRSVTVPPQLQKHHQRIKLAAVPTTPQHPQSHPSSLKPSSHPQFTVPSSPVPQFQFSHQPQSPALSQQPPPAPPAQTTSSVISQSAMFRTPPPPTKSPQSPVTVPPKQFTSSPAPAHSYKHSSQK